MNKEYQRPAATIFIRALDAGNKAQVLRDAICAPDKSACPYYFEVNPSEFRKVPGVPFAYWVSSSILGLFERHAPFEGGYERAKVTKGLATTNDERFARLWWEVAGGVVDVSGTWMPFAKGGKYSRFYSDIQLLIRWERAGEEVKAYLDHKIGRSGQWSRWINAVAYYGRPGITWSRRTQGGLSLRAMPAGCIFADKGPAAFVDSDEQTPLLALLAVSNSEAFRALVSLQMTFGSYEVGVIQRTPVPSLCASDERALADLAHRAWSIKRGWDTAELTSHAFVLPALLQVWAGSLVERADAWGERVAAEKRGLDDIQQEVDDRCFEFYGFAREDREQALANGVAESDEGEVDDAEEPEEEAGVSADTARLAAELVDWLVSVAFGRFDVRLATGEREPPADPEPFDSLPLCSPGMLTDDQGRPAEKVPADYPVDLPPYGLLVDDAGLEDDLPARWDIVQRVRGVLEVVFGDLHAPTVETELCQLLGVRDLRSYLQRSSGLFKDHLARCSRSRRKAPLFWPLSVNEKRYTVWLYYPQLTGDTLYAAIQEHVVPKITQVEDRRTQLEAERSKAEGREATRLGTRVSELSELLEELQGLRQELESVASLPYRPNLDDGVQISAAPLYNLFRLTPWRRDLEKTWRALREGQYDWSHLARAIWPDRVDEKCRTDSSLAIAHNREDLYQEEG